MIRLTDNRWALKIIPTGTQDKVKDEGGDNIHDGRTSSTNWITTGEGQRKKKSSGGVQWDPGGCTSSSS